MQQASLSSWDAAHNHGDIQVPGQTRAAAPPTSLLGLRVQHQVRKVLRQGSRTGQQRRVHLQGLGPDGSLEGSSSPTSSFPSKSKTSSDADRSEQHGSQEQPPGASMRDLQEALGQKGGGGGSSEDRKSSDSEEPKDPFSDSGSSASCPSASSAGEKSRALEQQEDEDEGRDAMSDETEDTWPGERKHGRESTSKTSSGGEVRAVIDRRTAGEIASLLHQMMEQQEQIMAQQRQILERGIQPGVEGMIGAVLMTFCELIAKMEAWGEGLELVEEAEAEAG
ncbi:hypothetical protein GUITHDRAFT_117461 [Guillardia theta CCMP2712]|uniref:Uncharacterized protein n=1 Tax=Guillardia theta (strain CCMP2712) TaxID=905079 RepID=L1IJT3_GUITC|nr:hypothetical protein GUITHDRAFT_117461 [Guillardia theta CCMP2712]EKX36352.1 hypothetical protein GUITHDRAFT_117461 [Guillardia theta CCMP2712]|eukprot:XP_005823332.1 hypothetical protein GUITHDRAFT_117461 [Guillardia theta CCMP2712]